MKIAVHVFVVLQVMIEAVIVPWILIAWLSAGNVPLPWEML